MAGLHPDACVIVATIRAMKYNGGKAKDDLSSPDVEALNRGIVNLGKHIENIQQFGVPVIVTLNAFDTDSDEETEFVRRYCENRNCEFALSKVWAQGGKGGVELAEKILYTLENKKSDYKPIYDTALPIDDKIRAIATKIYGASDVAYAPSAQKQMKKLTELGYDKLPICIAKTQYSLSDDPQKLGRPEGFTLNVRELYVSAGAGFVVAITGNINTMPGLSKAPAAYNIDIDDNGKITGLF